MGRWEPGPGWEAGPCLGEETHSLPVTKQAPSRGLELKPHPVAELICVLPVRCHPTLEKPNSLEAGFNRKVRGLFFSSGFPPR